MVYRLLADVVVVTHVAFLVFVAAGGLLAWRWPRLVVLHVPSVAWALGSITVGAPCPLTPLEKWFRGRAGDQAYSGGFVDRYLEGVLYREALTPVLWVVAAAAVVVGYAGLLRARAGAPARAGGPGTRGAGPLVLFRNASTAGEGVSRTEATPTPASPGEPLRSRDRPVRSEQREGGQGPVPVRRVADPDELDRDTPSGTTAGFSSVVSNGKR